MPDGYQHNYSDRKAEMFDHKSRLLRGKRVVTLLQKALGKKVLFQSTVLDVGCSTGIITSVIAKHCKNVIGVDIDAKAIAYAKKNCTQSNASFLVGDCMSLAFSSNSFDIVICSHVYEHVPKPKKLFDEVYRVLRPNGVCYAALCNKLWPIEPHYHLPFLSYLPKKIANIYVRLCKRGNTYYETLLSWWGLKKLLSKFEIVDYTELILSRPNEYGYEDYVIPRLPFAKYFAPTFFWLLIKKDS